MPHYVASDLGLHCLPTTLLYGFPGKNRLEVSYSNADSEDSDLTVWMPRLICTSAGCIILCQFVSFLM